MGKLIRRVTKEDLIKEEDVVKDYQEIETMQINEPIMTSDHKMDLSEISLGPIKLECNRCFKILTIGRNLGVNLSCPECGNDIFSSKSKFIMESLGNSIDVNVDDKVHRMGRMRWKIK